MFCAANFTMSPMASLLRTVMTIVVTDVTLMPTDARFFSARTMNKLPTPAISCFFSSEVRRILK